MKKITLALALILSINLVFSNPVDTVTAKIVAENFYKQNSVIGVGNGQTIRIRRQKPEYVVVPLDTMFTGFYVLNSINDDGFVIVSADNNVMPILGYSDEHSLNASNMPPAMWDWLYGYEMEIRRARIMDRTLVSDEVRIEWGALLTGRSLPNRNPNNVPALLETNWGQNGPYNLSCPSTTNGNVPTGCVATAMAQVMKYWEYPQTGVGSHTYTHPTYGTLSANFESLIAWNEMLNTYNSSSSYTLMQLGSISSLMYLCGVSVDMNYGVNGSGAQVINYGISSRPSAETALKTYFDYSNNLHGISKSEWHNNQWVDVYTNNQWMNILKNELDSGRVVLYRGVDNSEGGHAFVCDGYNNNYFHFNWGWDGNGNCYCLVTSLIPQNSTNNYTNQQQAIIGISPTNQPIHPSYDLMMYSSLTSSASTYQSGNDVIITGTVANVGNASFSGYIYAIVSDIYGNYVTEVQTYANIPANHHVTKTFTIQGGLPLAPGQYFVCLTSSSNPNDVNAARFIRDNLSHPNFVTFSVEYETTLETFSEFDVSPEIIYPGQSITVNVDILNAGITTFSGKVAVALISLEGTFVQFIQQHSLTSNSSLQPNYHFMNGLDFTGTVTAPAGDYFLALIWQELYTSNWLYAGCGHNYLNPVRITIREQPLADMYETNNTASTAYELTPVFSDNISSVNTDDANFHTQSDVDYYKIILPCGFAYSAIPVLEDVYYNNDISYSVDAKFYYAVDNTSSWNGPFDLDANIISCAQNEVVLNNGGTIYYKVVPSYTGDMGSYNLSVFIQRQILPDQYEENNTASTAYNLGTVNTNSLICSVDANFHLTTDNDYYKINLPSGYSYTINANILNSYNNSNYSADAKFATSTDGNSWSTSYGSAMPALTMSNGGTLYFRVLPYTSNEIGTYSLHVEITRTTVIEPDMYEANNTVSTAYSLGTVTSNSATYNVNANFHETTDNDYYKVNLPSGYSYTINANILSSYNNSSFTANAKFATSANGSTWSSNYTNSMSTLTFNNGGSLYFRVLPTTSDEIGTYLLNIEVTRTIVVEPDMYEPNNTSSTAYYLGTITSNSISYNINANFHVTTDNDYYKVNLPSGYSYTINANILSSYNNSSFTANAKFATSANGNTWSTNYTNSMSTLTFNNGGTLYFKVLPSTSNEIGTYLLNIEVTRTFVVEPDIYEPNNTSSTAYNLGTASSNSISYDINANFHVTTDNDYYKVNLPSGYTYTINANILSSYNNSSYTANAIFVTSLNGNTWSTFYTSSMSTLTIDDGGMLYFRVLPSSSNEIGTYSLHITVSASTKIDEYEEKLVQLYPNPTSDNLSITAPETVIIDYVEIFNEEGQHVKSIKGNVSSINVSELSKGLYFIRIHTDGEIVVRKFVKR